MEWIKNTLSNTGSILATIGVADAIDILIVAFLIFEAIQFVKKTNSYKLARGVIFLLVILGLSEFLGLRMLSFLLRKAMELGLIALVVLFQPELRRALERVGSGFSTGKGIAASGMNEAIAQTVLACKEMAEAKTGALILFERNTSLGDIINTGTIVNANVTAELLKNIFFNKAPLHDGAAVIRAGRIASAGCILPLTSKTNISKDLGTRHRAGIGISEQSDAVIVIVSEETGTISLAMDGILKRNLSAPALDKLLRAELLGADDENAHFDARKWITKFLSADEREKHADQERC